MVKDPKEKLIKPKKPNNSEVCTRFDFVLETHY